LKSEKDKDIKLMRLLQEDLALVPRPFDLIARKARLSPGALLKKVRALKASGAMRRYGAMIHHRNAGYSFNAMTAVDADNAVMKKLIARIMKTPEVTHCYERPAYPDWPFRLYFMLHAKSKEESRKSLAKLFEGIAVRKKEVLYSTREFKKVSFRL
jgi:DNA-binding Lrp family transcriptional regulator